MNTAAAASLPTGSTLTPESQGAVLDFAKNVGGTGAADSGTLSKFGDNVKDVASSMKD